MVLFRFLSPMMMMILILVTSTWIDSLVDGRFLSYRKTTPAARIKHGHFTSESNDGQFRSSTKIHRKKSKDGSGKANSTGNNQMKDFQSERRCQETDDGKHDENRKVNHFLMAWALFCAAIYLFCLYHDQVRNDYYSGFPYVPPLAVSGSQTTILPPGMILSPEAEAAMATKKPKSYISVQTALNRLYSSSSLDVRKKSSSSLSLKSID